MTQGTMRKIPVFSLVVLLAVAVSAAGCLYIFQDLEVQEIPPDNISARVDSPVKVHLKNGHVGVMPNGFIIQRDMLVGNGAYQVYDVALDSVQASGGIPIDSVLALESYEVDVNDGKTLFTSALATVGAVYGGAALAFVIFGSCPTIYDLGPTGETLESEAFSYSIASLLETKDFDRIHVTPDEYGVVHLGLRNEALETHYINQIELLRVGHGAGERAYPDGTGRAVVVSNERPPAAARASDGSTAVERLRAADAAVFSTPESHLENIGPGNTSDFLELAWEAPDAESAVIVFKLRNSLLNTIFFYDFMLANQGVGSVDWMHSHINSIDAALEMGTFFREHLGLRVLVEGANGYEHVGRIGGVGPIAWEEVALEVPVHQADSVRVRLEFLADAWRIDRVALGTLEDIRTPERIPVSIVTDAQAQVQDSVRKRLEASDEEYLVTGPGTEFTLEFSPAVSSAASASWFLAAQGYYTEWVRGSWIRQNERPEPLVLSEETLVRVIEAWRERKPEFEEQFFATRIPVR